jgi:hypothetical protein
MTACTATRIHGVGTEADPRMPWHEYQRALLHESLGMRRPVANGGAALSQSPEQRSPPSTSLDEGLVPLGLSHGDHGSSLQQ